MAQPKAQAPFIPGQKEAVDLVPDEQESSGRSVAEKVVSVLGSSGTSDGKSNGDDSGGDGGVGDGDGGGGDEEEAGGREKQQGDYYAPVETELVPKKGDVAHELYSPGAGVDVVTSEHKLPSHAGTEEQEQPGEASDAVDSGPGIVETGKGVATEVGDSLGSVRARVTEKLATLHLPSESLGAVKRAIGGAFTSTKDAVQRTQQSLVDILSSSSSKSSKSSSSVNQVVEDMEKNVLANSEGSGEDMSQVSEGPKLKTAPETAPETASETAPETLPETTPETGPKFMRAKL